MKRFWLFLWESQGGFAPLNNNLSPKSPLFPGFPEAGGDISVLFVLHQAERDLFPFGTVEGGVGSLQSLSG